MWIKICGNTNLEDAELAAQLGADAIGFVFAASPRQMTAAQVAAITPHLPSHVECIGVFHSSDAQQIAAIVIEAGLTAVQLHGALDLPLAQRLAEKFKGSVSLIQTLHWTVDPATESPAEQLASQIKRIARLGFVDRILIDSKVGAATGGTGVAFDWTAARALFASAPSGLHLIVAGGLNPQNLAHAIAQLNPWGVDVSSGIESSPGRKDHALLARFIQSVRAVTP
jgi:phosphoribosylanthranilate isomerase